jgi:hypothetical protein
MHQNITIRPATPNDAQGIIDIYYYWKEEIIDNDKSKKYYVLKNEFTLEQIKKICENGFATVAVDNDIVASFYFLNPYYDTGNLEQRKIAVNELIEKRILPKGKYAFSLLSSTHKDYQGKA